MTVENYKKLLLKFGISNFICLPFDTKLQDHNIKYQCEKMNLQYYEWK